MNINESALTFTAEDLAAFNASWTAEDEVADQEHKARVAKANAPFDWTAFDAASTADEAEDIWHAMLMARAQQG